MDWKMEYIWLYSMLFVFIYGWKCMSLDRKLCMLQKNMAKDYFSRNGNEIEMLIWMGKWKENDKELNLE